MSLLKKNNWFVCLILTIFMPGLFSVLLAYELKLIDKNAWYMKWQYWVFGGICLIFPIFIMLLVFMIQMMVTVANKLEVPGGEIYNTPYTWIICIIVPVLGWVLLLVMLIYINIWPIVMLYKGQGEISFKN